MTSVNSVGVTPNLLTNRTVPNYKSYPIRELQYCKPDPKVFLLLYFRAAGEYSS